ncbi:MAG: hypothetical protein ACKVP3_19395 [Hyphomicrobiaceae bacterium]
MIMHVAEAGEQRGRVVLHLRSGQPHDVALAAAFRIAHAFRSEIESLFVEDQQLLELAGFPFAREISLSGRRTRTLSRDDMARELRMMAHAISRKVERRARAAEIPMRRRIVCDDPVTALAAACAENGPWNVVALADPFVSGDCDALRHIFDNVTATTGLVIVGPQAKRSEGPVVAVIEDMAHLEPMVRSALRLLREEGEEITVLLIADDDYKAQWMEGQARLALGDTPAIRIRVGAAPRGSGAVIAEDLRRLDPGFVIARFGGMLIPMEGDLKHLAASLECPLFLMR